MVQAARKHLQILNTCWPNTREQLSLVRPTCATHQQVAPTHQLLSYFQHFVNSDQGLMEPREQFPQQGVETQACACPVSTRW